MKLSQPRSARTINTCRVLCALRNTKNLSKAELSRLLNLNKVSCGEIVDDLVEKGLVSETGKMEVSNGRRPTTLSIVYDSKYVLGVDVGRYSTSVALCDLNGTVVKVERIPTPHDCSVEEFCVGILKSCVRTVKLVKPGSLLGAGITVDGTISPDSSTVISSDVLPWTDIPVSQVFEKTLGCSVTVGNRTAALVNAEKQEDALVSGEENLMYLNWSESICLANVSYGHVWSVSNEFGRMQIGENTNLEDVCGATALGAGENVKMKEVWPNVQDSVFVSMAKALRVAYRITGTTAVIIGGEGATLTEPCLDAIRERCPALRINRSCMGDRAFIKASAELALDRFFYNSSMLEDMKDWM